MASGDMRLCAVVSKKLRPQDIALLECVFDEIADYDAEFTRKSMKEIKAKKLKLLRSTILFPFSWLYALITGGIRASKRHTRLQREAWAYLKTPLKVLTGRSHEQSMYL